MSTNLAGKVNTEKPEPPKEKRSSNEIYIEDSNSPDGNNKNKTIN